MIERLQQHSLVTRFSEFSNRVYFVFGGAAKGAELSPFEFVECFKDSHHHCVFFRDLSKSWYQKGIPPLGGTFFDIRDFVQETIDRLDPVQPFFVGNSMGGFAAILMGALIGRGNVKAFAPQTYLPFCRHLVGGRRRSGLRMLNACLRSVTREHVWDLRAALAPVEPEIRIDIHFSSFDYLDKLHARRLRDFDCVRLIDHRQGGHQLVRLLKEQGKLLPILLDPITTEVPSFRSGSVSVLSN